MELQTEVAKDLLRIEAVQIKTNEADYFTWTSGIKSPIYCDNRLTMSFPEVRKKIVTAFKVMLESLPYKPDVIAGCATAGIPHAAWLAEALDLPMVYVRSKPKGHGKENQIEGLVEKGQKAIVIEDLISTGGSSIEAADALREQGVEVEAVFAIFTYGLQKATNRFEEAAYPLHTITGFDHLLAALLDDQVITSEEEQNLLTWRNQL